jgi:hypothetical protein
MQRFFQHLFIFIVVSLPFLGHATAFDIEAMRIGPNPLVVGKDALIINYTATKAHTSRYYVYSIGGQLLASKQFKSDIPYTTHSGECKFELLNTSTMARFKKQLIVVFAVFESESHQIKKKKYVIVK